MDAKLESLVLRARAEHDGRPGASSAEIVEAEERIGYSFTADLRDLLLACNGMQFWTADDYPCRLLGTTEIKPAQLLFGVDDGPPGLVVLLEAPECFVAMELDRDSKGYSRLIDCFHETFPHELFGVCNSLQEMLALILESKCQEWIWPAARAYGVDFAE